MARFSGAGDQQANWSNAQMDETRTVVLHVLHDQRVLLARPRLRGGLVRLLHTPPRAAQRHIGVQGSSAPRALAATAARGAPGYPSCSRRPRRAHRRGQRSAAAQGGARQPRSAARWSPAVASEQGDTRLPCESAGMRACGRARGGAYRVCGLPVDLLATHLRVSLRGRAEGRHSARRSRAVMQPYRLLRGRVGRVRLWADLARLLDCDGHNERRAHSCAALRDHHALRLTVRHACQRHASLLEEPLRRPGGAAPGRPMTHLLCTSAHAAEGARVSSDTRVSLSELQTKVQTPPRRSLRGNSRGASFSNGPKRTSARCGS